MRRRADTHHASERLHEPLPCGDGSTFLGLGTAGTTWAGFLLPDQMMQQAPQQPPQPLQRGFLNCFFWCGGPSGNNLVSEDEDLEGDEDLAVGLPDVSRSSSFVVACGGVLICPPSCTTDCCCCCCLLLLAVSIHTYVAFVCVLSSSSF